jgi:prevent-host-death family protein
MKLSSQIKPISYLKAHAAEIVRNLGEGREPLVITQNGEAKVVLQDIESYERDPNTMALLKILALGNRQVEEGKVAPCRLCCGCLSDSISFVSHAFLHKEHRYNQSSTPSKGGIRTE